MVVEIEGSRCSDNNMQIVVFISEVSLWGSAPFPGFLESETKKKKLTSDVSVSLQLKLTSFTLLLIVLCGEEEQQEAETR